MSAAIFADIYLERVHSVRNSAVIHALEEGVGESIQSATILSRNDETVEARAQAVLLCPELQAPRK